MGRAAAAATKVEDGQITQITLTNATTEQRQADHPEPPPLDPLLHGLAAIKAEDPDALRIWQVKGPRQGGGVLLGVLLQSTGDVVIIHQLQSGKYAIYDRRRPETTPFKETAQ